MVSDIIAMVVTCCDIISHSQLIFRNGGCGRTFPGACSTAPKRLKTEAVCASRWKPWKQRLKGLLISAHQHFLEAHHEHHQVNPNTPPTSCWWIGMYLLCQRCVHHRLASIIFWKTHAIELALIHQGANQDFSNNGEFFQRPCYLQDA